MTEPWYSRHVLFSRERVASSRALSCQRALFHVGAWCSDPGTHVLSFVCWSCACVFVLCEHMAFVFVFCVSCARMSIVLTPPILLPDYWLICPTCISLVTLLICSRYNLLVFAVLCQFVIYVTIECILFLPCLAFSCQALPAVVFPLRGRFSFCLFFTNKEHSPAPLSPHLIPSSPTLT